MIERVNELNTCLCVSIFYFYRAQFWTICIIEMYCKGSENNVWIFRDCNKARKVITIFVKKWEYVSITIHNMYFAKREMFFTTWVICLCVHELLWQSLQNNTFFSVPVFEKILCLQRSFGLDGLTIQCHTQRNFYFLQIVVLSYI